MAGELVCEQPQINGAYRSRPTIRTGMEYEDRVEILRVDNCCLGVANHVLKLDMPNCACGLKRDTLPHWFEQFLIDMNDRGNSAFSEIADWIEGIARAEGWMK